MKRRECIKVDVEHQYPVILSQTGVDSFTVTYGKQVKERLTYAAAALEFGACVMHALACNGQLDNRTRGAR